MMTDNSMSPAPAGGLVERASKALTEAELQEVLRLHRLWLDDDPEGVRADLHGADLSWADLSEASLYGAEGLPIVADAPARLQVVAAQVLSNPNCLRMESWHGDCGTSHCLAGWAIHQAGPIGATLERLHGAHLAGLLLLGHDAASRFYQSNDEVLQWLRSISEVQP